MAEYTNPGILTVAAGQNVPLTSAAVNSKPCIVYRDGAGIVTLRGLTNQCKARFRVGFGGNIAVPTGGTVEAITAALILYAAFTLLLAVWVFRDARRRDFLAINGEPLNSAAATVTPAAVENYFNIYVSAIVEVPRGCCLTVAMENTSRQAISVANANMTVDRIS